MIDLDDLFGPGVFVHPPKHSILVSLVRGHRLGELRLPSGSVVVADPYLLDDASALPCPAGTFPVYLGASEMYNGDDFTGLCVRFGEAAVAKWEPVFAPGKGIPVDSASIAICDEERAADLKPIALSTRFRNTPLCGALFASGEIAACSVGSDGGYPIFRGLDARGEMVRLAVTAKRELVRWSYQDLPDRSRMNEVAAWIARVQGADRSFTMGATPPRLIQQFERLARRWAPPALREYYRYFRPWAEDKMALWQKWAPPGAFPLSLSRNGGHALLPDGSVREINERGLGGQALDIPSWLVLYAIVLYDLAT